MGPWVWGPMGPRAPRDPPRGLHKGFQGWWWWLGWLLEHAVEASLVVAVADLSVVLEPSPVVVAAV